MKLQRKSFFRLLFVLPLLLTDIAIAQSDPSGSSPATRTYAITNATIVQAPGKVIEAGTLVISDGIITQVGTNVSIPGNAEVIDGTDHFIYAGFIDGMSNAGSTRPEQMERPDNLFTPDPPNEYAGITPELSVLDALDVTEKGIASLRNAGFTMGHTVPQGRMLPGSGSIIFFSEKTHPDELLYQENVSMYTQFRGAPGAYPGNVLGIMAKWRNLYRNAELLKSHTEMYAENPTGIERPSKDRVLQAYFPVVEKTQPVYYNAPSLLEAQRTIRMQKEMGFNLVIGNLAEAWPLADDIKANNSVSVFLSLDLPDEPKEGEDDATEEAKALEARRLEFYNKQLGQFALYDSLDIPFGFSTMDANSAKIRENILRVTEHGFDTTAALAALTVDAASILGLSNVAGTVETGKLGNVVILDGPYFQKSSNIKFMFVDGDKYEIEVKKKGKGSPVSEGSKGLVGTWNYSMTTPQGEQTGTFVFSTETGSLSGIVTSNDGTPDLDMNNLTILDGTLSFDVNFDAGGQVVEIVFVGDVADSEIEGEGSIAAFNVTFPFSASKQTPN